MIVAADSLDVPEIARLLDRLDPRRVDLFAGNASVLDAVSPVRSTTAYVARMLIPTRRADSFPWSRVSFVPTLPSNAGCFGSMLAGP